MVSFYLEHTYLWASLEGEVNLSALPDTFLFVMVASAFFFYLIHRILPYTPTERLLDPRLVADPPAKVFLSFSKGQLISFVPRVVGLPIMVCGLFPYPQVIPVTELSWGISMVLCFLVFFIAPTLLEKRIDGT